MSNRKKATITFSVVFAIIIITVLTPYITLSHACSGADKIIVRCYDFYDAETEELISGQNEITVTDKNDIKALEELCSKKNIFDIISAFDVPACFFDTVEIVFIKGNQQTTVCPSPDGCNNLLILSENGNKYYHTLSEREMKRLIEILKDNDVSWNW